MARFMGASLTKSDRELTHPSIAGLCSAPLALGLAFAVPAPSVAEGRAIVRVCDSLT